MQSRLSSCEKRSKIFSEHIVESIQLIGEFAHHLTAEKFQKNKAMQDAIIRRLEIIGEAVKNISASFKAYHPDIHGGKWQECETY